MFGEQFRKILLLSARAVVLVIGGIILLCFLSVSDTESIAWLLRAGLLVVCVPKA